MVCMVLRATPPPYPGWDMCGQDVPRAAFHLMDGMLLGILGAVRQHTNQDQMVSQLQYRERERDMQSLARGHLVTWNRDPT